MALARGVVAVIVLALASGACGGQSTTTGQPTNSSQPTTSTQPTPTGLPSSGPSQPTTTHAPPTGIPNPDATPAPLPQPELTTIDDIIQAMGVPGAGEQVVVSMLDLLGIGLYNADGTRIRAGSESSDSDMYLFEPEARGLAHLFEAQFQGDGWIDFRAFHDALTQYGYIGSADALAGEYDDLFNAEADDPMTQLVGGHLEVDQQVSKFAAWFLFVDGFVRHGSAAARHAGLAQTSSRTTGRAVAQLGGGLILDATVMAHLMLVAASAQPILTLNPTRVHEGHGGPGAPAEIKAQVHAVGLTWISPFTGASLIPVRVATTDGIGVEFEPNSTMSKHGGLSSTTASTDAAGQATVTYTPRKEPLNGQGVLVSTIGTVTARVSMTDIMTQLYGQPALATFAPTNALAVGQLQIEWHAEPPLLIDFKNTYDLHLPFEVMGTAQTAGEDTIQADLIESEDDPGRWEGTALANAQGTFSGELMGHSCSSSWDAQQILQVTGLEDPGSGEMLFVFDPITDPLGSTGSNPTCSRGLQPLPTGGIFFIPFNDIAVTDPGIGLRFNVAIPRPGFFETDYPTPLQGTGVTGSANWHVRIEFKAPPP